MYGDLCRLGQSAQAYFYTRLDCLMKSKLTLESVLLFKKLELFLPIGISWHSQCHSTFHPLQPCNSHSGILCCKWCLNSNQYGPAHLFQPRWRCQTWNDPEPHCCHKCVSLSYDSFTNVLLCSYMKFEAWAGFLSLSVEVSLERCDTGQESLT